MTFDPNQKRGHPSNPGAWSAYENTLPDSNVLSMDYTSLPTHEVPAHSTEEGIVEVVVEGDDQFRTSYRFVNDQLSNPRGPAVARADGFEEFWVQGIQLTPPSDEFRLSSVDELNTITWVDSCAGRVEKFTNGDQVWTNDGDLHRDGAPAIVRTNGQNEWYRRGTRIDDPTPPPPKVEDTNPGLRWGFVTTTGARYEGTRRVLDVAADLRRNLEAAREAHYLPEHLTYETTFTDTVRAGRRSITVTVHGLSTDEIYPDDSAYYGPDASEINHKLRAFLEMYNMTTVEKSADGLRQHFDPTVRFASRNRNEF